MVADGVFVTGLLTSYCTVQQVLRLLEGHDLSALGTLEDVEERVLQLMGPTQEAVEACAGRDFRLHLEDVARVDGPGTGTLSLGRLGYSPVGQVRGVWVDGDEIPGREYVVYGDEGTIRLKPQGRLGGRFRVGAHNVEVCLDWGYEAVPAEISLAQARLIGAQLLGEAAGGRGSVDQMRLGDYSVSYDGGGEHAGLIARWVADAEKAVGRYRRLRLTVV